MHGSDSGHVLPKQQLPLVVGHPPSVLHV